MRIHTFILVLACLGVGLGVAGCGVKPGDVSPPDGAENSSFPRTYPDVRADPRPEG